MSRDRDRDRAAFLHAAGWAGAAIQALPGDASFRRYFRLCRGEARAMLMDAPPPQEDVRPFLEIARILLELGYSAPHILAEDVAGGFLILEDLGCDTYTRLIDRGFDEATLYRLAGDLLSDLHARVGPAEVALPPFAGLPRYTDARFLDEAALLVDWFLPEATGAPAPAELRAEYLDAWRAALPLARAAPETLVLRDFHIDNLMLLPGRPGLRACGLLDFQDAVVGPSAYDLVSLLEDARRDVDPAVAAETRARYGAARPGLDREAFEAALALLGAQRHAKVIGIFCRLMRRDGKSGYLRHLPRLWRLLERALAHQHLESLNLTMRRLIPDRLRAVPIEPQRTPGRSP